VDTSFFTKALKMKTKYLLLFSTSIVIALSLILLSRKSVKASEPIFFCQSNEKTPVTIIKTGNGTEKPVFHWNLDEINTSASSQQLCNSVTQKLNHYSAAKNDLSSLIFEASIALDNTSSAGLPAICVAGEKEPCKLLLFTLEPSDNPQVSASNALDSILSKDLRTHPAPSPRRGVQSTYYKVNIWKLLGL
jgi:hypothetical protein